MHRTHVLIRSIVAFDQDTKKVFTIPAGARINLPVSANAAGVVSVQWGGKIVMISREDVEENGLSAAAATRSV